MNQIDACAAVQSAETKEVRKVYLSPTFVRYGNVAVLTKSGVASTTSDSGNNGMSPTKPSDRDIKENIVAMGVHPLGIGMYLYDYKSEFQEKYGSGKFFGVMADELETVLPQAVFMNEDGYKVVAYGLLANAISGLSAH